MVCLCPFHIPFYLFVAKCFFCFCFRIRCGAIPALKAHNVYLRWKNAEEIQSLESGNCRFLYVLVSFIWIKFFIRVHGTSVNGFVSIVHIEVCKQYKYFFRDRLMTL
jgi:hypothetical protein